MPGGRPGSAPARRPPRTPNFPPEQKAAIAVAFTGIIVNVIPGVPEEAKSNATDLALVIGPTLTFGGVGLRAARAKFLAPHDLLVADDPKTPLNERIQGLFRLWVLAGGTVLIAVGLVAIILWVFAR
jgi:hypothetical protein